LKDLGHPKFLNEIFELPCSITFEEAERKVITLLFNFVKILFDFIQVSDTNEVLNEWQKTIENLHREFSNLTFFSISKVTMLYEVITAEEFIMNKLIQEIAFLFQNTPGAIKKLRIAVQSFITVRKEVSLNFLSQQFVILHNVCVCLCVCMCVCVHVNHHNQMQLQEVIIIQRDYKIQFASI